MRGISVGLTLTAALIMGAALESLARGPGGRGGGGGGRTGGGGARAGGMSRPSAGRSPAISGGSRPSAARPATGARPSTGAHPSTGARPSTGAVARPGTGAATRPATGARPVGGAGVANRPATGTRPGGATGGAGRPAGARPGIASGRPSAGQLDRFLDVPRASTGAIAAGAGAATAGGAAADFLRGEGAGRPSTLPADRLPGNRPIADQRPGIGERPGIADRPALTDRPSVANQPGVENRQDRRQDFAQNRPERIDNRQQWQENRQQRRDEVRGQIADNYPRLDFWSDHQNWAAWRINRPYRWATWGALTGWVGYGWSEPAYYNYGDNIYYSEDQVYYGDQASATTEQYAVQAETIVASAPEKQPQECEWLPLGVFAITQDGQSTGADPTLFLQLAISKEGIISGTFKNMATGETQTVEGMADKKSQRSAWGVAGKERPIMETGIYNLTQDTAPALVHFADGQTQQWLLVRLEEPKEQVQAQTPAKNL